MIKIRSLRSRSEIKLFLLLTVVIFFTSCDNDRVYYDAHAFDGQEWHKDSLLVFKTQELPKINQPVMFEVHFRHNLDYPFRNLWLFLELEMPNGNIRRDTLQQVFMNPNGTWKEGVEGSGNAKESYVTPYVLKTPLAGVYKLKVQHGMRQKMLPGILNVGCKVKKLNIN